MHMVDSKDDVDVSKTDTVQPKPPKRLWKQIMSIEYKAADLNDDYDLELDLDDLLMQLGACKAEHKGKAMMVKYEDLGNFEKKMSIYVRDTEREQLRAKRRELKERATLARLKDKYDGKEKVS